MYFNPRSREGSDKLVFAVTNPSNISIHAPAKGATAVPIGKIIVCIYFNPRSREGSDIVSSLSRTLICDFNPRSREGSDDFFRKYCNFTPEISIHAPAKGATMTKDDAKAMVTISIHAPAKGATRQPRPLGKFKGISIHAPAKGATSELRR